MPVKVLIADDHPIIYNGIKLMIQDNDAYEIVGFVQALDDLESVARQHSPDVLLLDLLFSDRNSLKILKEFTEKIPRCKVIVFTSHDAPFLIKYSLDNGADGFLLKDARPDELKEAIESVLEGKPYISKIEVESKPQIQKNRDFDVFEQMNQLSSRELEVAKLKVDGLTTSEIADSLYISYHTAKTHLKNILKKLDIHNSVELANYLNRMSPYLQVSND